MGVYRKRRMTIGSTGWTAIVPDISCYAIVLRNEGPKAIILRTDESDPDTEDQIDVGLQEIIRSPNWYLAGQRVCSLKVAQGQSTVICSFSG